MPEIVSLSLATADLLCEHLAIQRLPAPFEIPSAGATDVERAALRHQMWRDLRARGLSSRDHVLEPAAEDMVAVLARYDSAISSLAVTTDGRLVRALAAANSKCAVLAVQGAEYLRIVAIDPIELPLSVVDLLPPTRPFPGRQVTVPDGERAPILERARIRGGYFIARSRTLGSHRTSAELAWVDTDRGRFSSRSVRGYTTHTPVGRHDLVAQLADLLSELSDQSREQQGR